MSENLTAPTAPVDQAQRDREILSALTTPHGFALGDVIAQTVLASPWLAARDAAQRAEGAETALRKAAEDLDPVGADWGDWEFQKWLTDRADQVRVGGAQC